MSRESNVCCALSLPRLTLESSEEASAASSAEAKMARLMARTQHAADQRGRRKGKGEGGGISAGADDALTTMAEEQAHRVRFANCTGHHAPLKGSGQVR